MCSLRCFPVRKEPSQHTQNLRYRLSSITADSLPRGRPADPGARTSGIAPVLKILPLPVAGPSFIARRCLVQFEGLLCGALSVWSIVLKNSPTKTSARFSGVLLPLTDAHERRIERSERPIFRVPVLLRGEGSFSTQ